MARSASARTSLRDDERLDRLFYALSNRTRRAIVKRLADGPKTVGEIASPFAMTLPAVSKHIRVLEDAKLVSRKQSGGVRVCALTGAPFEDAASWIDAHRSMWEGALDRLARHVESKS